MSVRQRRATTEEAVSIARGGQLCDCARTYYTGTRCQRGPPFTVLYGTLEEK